MERTTVERLALCLATSLKTRRSGSSFTVGRRCLPGNVCPVVNPVREPDAGNPHVRFDEREVETEHGGTSKELQL